MCVLSSGSCRCLCFLKYIITQPFFLYPYVPVSVSVSASVSASHWPNLAEIGMETSRLVREIEYRVREAAVYARDRGGVTEFCSGRGAEVLLF